MHVIKGVKVKIEFMYTYPIQSDFDFNHLVHFFPPETWPNIATVILIVANKQYLIKVPSFCYCKGLQIKAARSNLLINKKRSFFFLKFK